ncbi:hypothetical protein HPB48_012163 [Haemaphysalis longicornis]|uniref:Uncharacterized protein n=1 Tax=Haemaphysalis longicornis TaxID=44386 RepID=A0A9J6GV02_HAELO|nr:hypothetical protein HPB48_012163 [Haemaphysalis longicornis]
MEGIEVQGKPISPQEITKEAGWLESHLRRGARALTEVSATSELQREQDDAGPRSGNRISRAQQQLRRQKRMPRQPPLLKKHIKVVFRPRTGLDVTKVSNAGIRDGVLCVTGLSYEEAAEDLIRINSIRNIIIASTTSVPSREIHCRAKTSTRRELRSHRVRSTP